MPRPSDIEMAWHASIQQEPNGQKTVTTQRFVQELSKVNWNWTMKQANEWIEWYVTTFRDVSTYQRRKGRTVPFSFSIQTEDYSHGLPFTCQ